MLLMLTSVNVKRSLWAIYHCAQIRTSEHALVVIYESLFVEWHKISFVDNSNGSTFPSYRGKRIQVNWHCKSSKAFVPIPYKLTPIIEKLIGLPINDILKFTHEYLTYSPQNMCAKLTIPSQTLWPIEPGTVERLSKVAVFLVTHPSYVILRALKCYLSFCHYQQSSLKHLWMPIIALLYSFVKCKRHLSLIRLSFRQ